MNDSYEGYRGAVTHACCPSERTGCAREDEEGRCFVVTPVPAHPENSEAGNGVYEE